MWSEKCVAMEEEQRLWQAERASLRIELATCEQERAHERALTTALEVYTHTQKYTRTHTHTRVYMYMNMYVYIYRYIYIYI